MKKIKNFFGRFKNFFKPKIISEKIFFDKKNFEKKINWNEKIFLEKLKFFIKILIFFLFILLFWNPSFWISEEDKKNISYEVVFWIDNSLSMLAEDWQEKNRFERAKNKISDILNITSWEFWFLEFSWESFISIPFTSDKNSFLTILKKTEINKSWNSSTDFNSIKKNLSRIFDLEKWKDKILVLLSDWENQENYFDDFDYFKKNRIHILTIWFWDKKWSRIFLWEKKWEKIYKKYEWKEVLTKLDEKFLEKISEKTWWKYFFESENSEKILKFFKNNFEKKIISEKNIEEKKYFQFFAFLIFIIIILEIYLCEFFILLKNTLIRLNNLKLSFF